MPPRYSYWTIIAGGLPTAFRAAEREELMPTFTRLRVKHPDAEMKWFARGKLWDSPHQARQELEQGRGARDGGTRGDRPAGRPRPAAGDARGRDWRPGGEHRDPRQKFKDAKKAKNLQHRREKFARKHGRPEGERPNAAAARPRTFDGPRDGRRGPPPRGEGRDTSAAAARLPKATWERPRDGAARPPKRFAAPGREGGKRDWSPAQPREGGNRGWERPREAKPSGARRDGESRPPRREWDRPRATGDQAARGPQRRPWNPNQPREGARPPKREWERDSQTHSRTAPPRGGNWRDRSDGSGRTFDRSQDGGDRSAARRTPDRDPSRRHEGTPRPRPFGPKAFGRNQGTDEPTPPPRPRGPNREPRPSEQPEPTAPPRPNEPVIQPPGPPERGRSRAEPAARAPVPQDTGEPARLNKDKRKPG